MKLLAMLVSAAFVALVTASAIAADSCEGRKRYTIYYATHAFEQPFFPILEAGAARGALDACLNYKWTQDVDFSIASAIERMEKAISEKPDMLVFSLADPVAMRPALERALAVGIPVILINVPPPAPPSESLPYLIYIGPDEHQGGVKAAKLVLAKMKPARAACLDSLPGHAGTAARCRGWAETLEAAGVDSDEVDVSGGPAKAESALLAYMQSNPGTDAFVTTTGDPKNFGVVVATLVKKGMGGRKVALVTFDLTPEVAESIKAGDTLAAIDQQQYLQGYLPAVLARQYLEAGMVPVQDIQTGPAVVNAANVDQVLEAINKGRR